MFLESCLRTLHQPLGLEDFSYLLKVYNFTFKSMIDLDKVWGLVQSLFIYLFLPLCLQLLHTIF